MLTGCMPVVAREDQEWNSPEDFLGSKMADSKSRYALFHELVDEGHDLDKEITFTEYENDSEEIQAVLKGEIDYATIGTGRMYEVEHTDGLKIVTYVSEENIKDMIQKKCRLAVDYGDWFGGERFGTHIRINLATSHENVKIAVDALVDNI